MPICSWLGATSGIHKSVIYAATKTATAAENTKGHHQESIRFWDQSLFLAIRAQEKKLGIENVHFLLKKKKEEEAKGHHQECIQYCNHCGNHCGLCLMYIGQILMEI